MMRREEHVLRRKEGEARYPVMKVGIHGKGIEDALREDSWTN